MGHLFIESTSSRVFANKSLLFVLSLVAFLVRQGIWSYEANVFTQRKRY